MEADFRVLRIMVGVMIPRVTLRFTLGYEPLASLGHSTFQVVLRWGFYTDFADFFVWWCEVKRVIISLSEASLRLIGITLAVMRLYGNFVAVSGGLRYGYWGWGLFIFL